MSSSTILPGQIRRINVHLTELGLNEKDTKADIVSKFSAVGHSSTKGLKYDEAEALIAHLVSQSPEAQKQKLRRKLLSLGYDMHWHKDAKKNSDLAGMHPSKINAYNVNAWCMSDKCKVGKDMNEMTIDELNQTITQLKLVKKSVVNG
ncbi:MAG: hypothetical protein ABJG41_09950 [Cyclobacteriaceae bacterium]